MNYRIRSLLTLIGLATISCSSPTEPPTVDTIVVSSSSGQISAEQTLQLVAKAYDSKQKEIPGVPIAWRSQNLNLAAVSSKGLVTGKTHTSATKESVTINATAGDVTGEVTLEVLPVPVSSVVVSPSIIKLRPEQQSQLSSVQLNAQGESLLSRSVQWASSDTTVVTVSQNGVLRTQKYTGPAIRTSVVTASSEGKTGTVTVTVEPWPVFSITVPTTVEIAAGGTKDISPVLKDSLGNQLTGRSVTWTSDSAEIATVSVAGRISTTAYFSDLTKRVTIRALSEGVPAALEVVVLPIPVASLRLDRPQLTLLSGDSVTLPVTIKDSLGRSLQRKINWQSSDSLTLRVDTSGRLIARNPGSAKLTASVGSKADSTLVTIQIGSKSCRNILLANPQATTGTYTLRPSPSSSDLTTALCDMQTDGGGWTKIFGHKVTNMIPRVVKNSTLNDGLKLASTDSGAVLPNELQALFQNGTFSEIRIFCTQYHTGRKVSLKTSDAKVVSYLIGIQNVYPIAPGSFTRLGDDSAITTQSPTRWPGGQWGPSGLGYVPAPSDRMTDVLAYIPGERTMFMLIVDGLNRLRHECDTLLPTDVNGEWSIWIR